MRNMFDKNVPTGWELVTTGCVNPGDCFWSDDSEKWEPVASCYYNLRISFLFPFPQDSYVIRKIKQETVKTVKQITNDVDPMIDQLAERPTYKTVNPPYWSNKVEKVLSENERLRQAIDKLTEEVAKLSAKPHSKLWYENGADMVRAMERIGIDK